MSKYTTSPGNEADVTRVDVVAVSGTTPTVVTRDEIWMGNSLTPTVSTEDTIRANSSTTPTAGNSTTPTVSTVDTIRASNGLTPTVIENTSNVGPVAEGVSTPTAQGVNGNLTDAGSNGSVAQGNGATPTGHLLRVIVATEGTANVAVDRSTVTTAQERLAA